MTELICVKILAMNQGKDHFANLYDIKMNLKDKVEGWMPDFLTGHKEKR
jgi:hypothetical protein